MQVPPADYHTIIIDDFAYQCVHFRTCKEGGQYIDFPGESILQASSYHKALETAPPSGMVFHYVKVLREDKPVGMLCFQIKAFNVGESLRNQIDGTLTSKIRYMLGRKLEFDVLCLGNTLVTGDYGFTFAEDIPFGSRTMIMMKVLDWLLLKPAFKSVRMIFIKDFFEDIFKDQKTSKYCTMYHPIATEQNMIMDIHSDWNSFDDYLRSLKSKYRIRANKSMSLSEDLTRRELTYEEIVLHKLVLHDLYKKVSQKVGFNLFTLSPDYFAAVKHELGDAFRVWVYEKDGEIISFFSVIEDGSILDAHFLGYDDKSNQQYKLYMNMLLAMIEHSIKNRFTLLQLSRTASEIKSSVGAKGYTMWAYLRHRNSFLNWIFPRIYKYFQPDLDWVPRMPFSGS